MEDRNVSPDGLLDASKVSNFLSVSKLRELLRH